MSVILAFLLAGMEYVNNVRVGIMTVMDIV